MSWLTRAASAFRAAKQDAQLDDELAFHIAERTDELLRMEEGSLYPALHRMEQAGWITASWQVTDNNRRARVYRLTRAGQKRLSDEQARWDRLTAGVARVMRFV